MQINFLAVVVAAVVHFIIGAVWYSPLLFQKLWMELEGIKESTLGPKEIVWGVINSLVIAYVLAYFVQFGAATLAGGAMIGFLAWLGFIATLLSGDVIFSKKPIKLFILRASFNLIALAVIGAILAVWR